MKNLLHELVGGEGHGLGGHTADVVEGQAAVETLLHAVLLVHIAQRLAQRAAGRQETHVDIRPTWTLSSRRKESGGRRQPLTDTCQSQEGHSPTAFSSWPRPTDTCSQQRHSQHLKPMTQIFSSNTTHITVIPSATNGSPNSTTLIVV